MREKRVKKGTVRLLLKKTRASVPFGLLLIDYKRKHNKRMQKKQNLMLKQTLTWILEAEACG